MIYTLNAAKLQTKMLYIVYCTAIHYLTTRIVLAQHETTYTNCVHVGTISVYQNLFLNMSCPSPVYGAILCVENAKCNVFSYNHLSKICVFYRSIDTTSCQLNEENGGTTFTKVTAVDVCPYEWMRFGNSCYLYDNIRKLPWNNATEYCTSQGGYLAEITDEEEFQLVDSVITANVFLGCRHFNGKWKWITSGRELLLNDTLWTPGEPADGRQCLQIWKGRQFDDTRCNKLTSFLCEKAVLFV